MLSLGTGYLRMQRYEDHILKSEEASPDQNFPQLHGVGEISIQNREGRTEDEDGPSFNLHTINSHEDCND